MNRRLRAAWTALPAVVFLLGADPLGAQGLLGRAPGAEIGVSAQSLRRGSGSAATASDATYRQWLRLPFRGALLAPRILAYDLTIQPAFTQRTAVGLPEALQTEELAFTFGARLFSNKLLGLTVTSARSGGETSGGFGADGRYDTGSMSAIVHLRSQLLPMELSFAEVDRENSWSSATTTTPIEWSNLTRTVRFSARNRKINARVERLEFEDRIGNADFSSLDASFSHRLRWGKGSELESAYDHNEREGSLVNTRDTWRERLRLQHTETVATDWSMQRSGLMTPSGERQSGSYSGVLNARLGDWGGFGLQGARRSTRFDGSRDESWSAGPTLRVAFALPLGARVSLGGGAGREWRTRENIAGGVLDVVDESHSVDATLSFLLRQPDVLRETVSLRSADLGTLFTEGFDYQLVLLDDLVEVVVLTGGRIREGERLLVTYRYRLGDLPSGALTTARYDASLSIRGLSVQHTRSLRDAPGENGEATLGFSTFDESFTRIALDLRRGQTRFEAQASQRDRSSSAFDFRTRELSSSLILSPRFGVSPALGASARETSDDGGRFNARSLYANLLWTRGRVRASGRLNLLELSLAQGEKDRSVSGSAELGMEVGMMEIQLRAETDRRWEPTRFSGSRLYARVIRRF
ncbi:MAG: hypothetical protein R3E10_15960 [Gemmatimonadota bacterium]